MSENRTGWRRDRDRPYRDDDRDWNRRTEDYRREGAGWGRDRDYGRDASGRDWAGRDWNDRSRDRGFTNDESHRRDWSSDWNRDRRRGWDQDRDRDEWSGRYGREDWGRGYRRLPGYGGMMGGAPSGAWGFSEEYGRDPGWDYGMSSGYGGGTYGRDRYGYNERAGSAGRGQDRGWWDRASDEVSSWFGDEDAERRRRDDARRDVHRGHGPRGYTRSDDRIREDVSDRLTDNPILDATEIEVAVSSGEVTLSGHVDSRYSKRLAEDIAEDVSGVRHVQNNLRVRESRDSISGTYSGISEGGTTSDLGSTSRSGISGSTGTGNTAGSMSGSTTGNTTTAGTRTAR
ncbi:MAG TPA: BON domain-containing protein [Acetobacteraceae bacterium]|nr:BON domain-containing protein [Acetobacteraceae bacterium]